MITWEDGFSSEFKYFLDEVFESSPDFIVPVTRKSAKLFRSVELKPKILKRIFYRQYFDYMNVSVEGKSVAIVDNTVERATTLREYRKFFESRGAEGVKTFAFVAHEDLGYGRKMPLDKKMEKPRKILTEAAYREYLIIESNYLITQGFEQDINHLILEINLNLDGIDFQETSQSLYEILREEGFTYFVPPFFKDPIRISLDSPEFFLRFSDLHPNGDFFTGINKIRFHLGSNRPILCVPMVFPRVKLSKANEFAELDFPFLIPLQEVVSKRGFFAQQLYYCSVGLLLSAELGRTLFCFLKENSTNNHGFIDFKNITVNTVDFQRYFGNYLGHKMARSVKKFIKKEEFNPSLEMKETVCRIVDFKREKKTIGSFSGKKANIVIERLKEGYEKKKRKKEKIEGVHYYLSLPEMKKVSGCSYFNLTQIIDSTCDMGILVPKIREFGQWLERAWRTGETKEIAWDRTIRLIPFAIEVMSTKLGDPHHRVGKMLLNKALVNFAWDYPSYERQIHSLDRESGMFGPVAVVNNSSKLEGKMGIQYHKYLGDKYYLEEEKTHRKYFYSRKGSLDDFAKFVNNETVTLSYNEIHAYFSLITEIYKLFGRKGEGKVDVLTALAICRNFDTFLDQIHYHLRIWNQHFRVFLDDLGEPSMEESLYDLEMCRTSAKQGFKKVRMFEMSEKITKKIQREFEESLEYKTILPKILKRKSFDRKDTLSLIKKIFRIQRALGALSMACFFPEKCKKKSPKKMIVWSEFILKVNGMKIPRDFRDNNKSLYKFLRLCNQALGAMIDSIPKVRILFKEEREGYFYLDSTRSLAEQYAKDNSWQKIAILSLDLKDFRKYENQDKVALMHQTGDKVAGRNNLYPLTQNKSDDKAVYATGNVAQVLYGAAEIKTLMEKRGVEVHIGVTYGTVNVNRRRDSVIQVFAFSSELCNYDREEIRNEYDVFVDEKSIELIRKEFPDFERYCEKVTGASLDGIQVYRLLCERFLKEYPIAKNTIIISLDKWIASTEDKT